MDTGKDLKKCFRDFLAIHSNSQKRLGKGIKMISGICGYARCCMSF